MSEQARPTSHRRATRHTFTRPVHPLPGEPYLRPVPGQPAQPPIAAWERLYLRAVIGSDLLASALGLAVGVLILGSTDNHYAALPALSTAVVVLGALIACRAWRTNVPAQAAEQ